MRLCDSFQPALRLSGGELEQYLVLGPGESGSLAYTFHAVRGSFAWKEVRAVVGDPLGLVETGFRLPADGNMLIKPRTRRFKPVQMRPHSTLHSPGSIPARLGGSGTDFWGVREYHQGDSLRRLDWRQTARHPYQFFTKEFEQEEIAEIGLILDGRRKVEQRSGADSLFERCLESTASLAEMFLHQGHRVSLLVYGDTMQKAFPGYGKIQLHRMLECLARARVGGERGSLDNLDFLPIRMFPSQALIVFISPLSAHDWALFPRLRALGYQVLLVSPDPVDFASQNLPDKLQYRLAVQAARIERHLKLRSIAQLQITVVDWQVNQPLFPLLQSALSRPRGQRH